MFLISFLLTAARRATVWSLALPFLFVFAYATQRYHRLRFQTQLLYLVSLVVTTSVSVMFWVIYFIDPGMLHPDPVYVSGFFQTHVLHTFPVIGMWSAAYILRYKEAPLNYNWTRQELAWYMTVLICLYFSYIWVAFHALSAESYWPYPMMNNLDWKRWILLFWGANLFVGFVEKLVVYTHNMPSDF